MNGINNKENLTLKLKDKIDINKQLKNSQNIKFILALILSNVSIFLLSFNNEKPTALEEKAHLAPQGYSTISVEAESFLSSNNPQAISIITKNHQIISTEAKLIAFKNHKYQIDIKNEDLIKIPRNEDEKLIITPQIINKLTNKTIIQKRDQYEITF